MTATGWLVAAQWFFIAYFIAVNAAYLVLNTISFFAVRGYAGWRESGKQRRGYAGLEPGVSVLVPAYNEERTIAASVRSILQLDYQEFEVLVINDGSKDGTLETLVREFALVPYPGALRLELPCQPVRAVYRSTRIPNLRVIDKENGGKADALNAGIDAARHPLFCAIDADSILQRDSLWRVVEPFLDHPDTVATGGTVRLANGCTVEGGFLTRIGLPRNLLALLQIVEYLRAFLFGRMGWSPCNAVLVISGAFGLFRRDAVVAAGGYSTRTVGEDMELVVRLHRLHRLQRKAYRVVFVPEPICWTEAPESLAVLRSQRARWHRGLSESLAMNLPLLFHPRGGAVGWLAMPFMLLFEWLSPLIEMAGYLFMLTGAALGLLSPQALGIFLLVSFAFGALLSVNALLVEELTGRIYPRFSQLAVLMLAALVENLGYRQIVSWYRFVGFIRWACGSRAGWGEMKRTAGWRKDAAS
jgi:cellulose synthase/poly-beta-1,6-N-acetylglucosamine synthase-like glycosyltransferase